MADESGPLGSLSQLIPSVYYDLIARVCAGAPFLVLLLWEDKGSLRDLASNAWVGFLLLMGAGYLAGLVLTPLSFFWNVLIGLPIQIMLNKAVTGGKRIRLSSLMVTLWPLWSRNDEIAAADKEAGTVVAKMQAEATLCQNLLSAYVVLIIANEKRSYLVPALGDHGSAFRWIVFLGLLAAAVFRTVTYLGRQNNLHRIHILKQKVI